MLLPVGRRLEYFHLGVFLSVFLAWHCYLWICEYSYLGVVTCGYESIPTLVLLPVGMRVHLPWRPEAEVSLHSQQQQVLKVVDEQGR